MGAGEMHRWMAYEAVEPFLSTRVDLAGGIVASIVANVNRGKGSPAFDPLDFMPIQASARDEAEARGRAALRFPPPEDEDDAMLQRMVAAYG